MARRAAFRVRTCDEVRPADPGRTSVETSVAAEMRRSQPAWKFPSGVAPVPGVVPFVNHGRWLAWCPNPACRGGCELVSKTDRRFFCCQCGNADVGGQWIPVAWPDETVVNGVERALGARRDRSTRNWGFPNRVETVTDLQTENRTRGVR